METIVKMINVFAWIAVIILPIIIFLKAYFQVQYKGSVEELFDKLQNRETSYSHNNFQLLLLFIVALVYLIVK